MKIESIRYPNTVRREEQKVYMAGHKGYNGCDKLVFIEKNGEMAAVRWIQVIYTGDRVIAEIKESVCDIYYE